MMKSQRGKTPRKTPGRKPSPTQTDPVEVFCRLRPLEDSNDVSCVKVVSANTLILSMPESSMAAQTARNGGMYKEVQNTFQHVFDDLMSQKALFDRVALPLVTDVLHGKNALLFAYGVTNSGKTHTMTGSPQEQGILPRSLDVIFNSLQDLQAKKYVFKPDKMNGFDVQTEADAMLERQRRDITPKMMNTAPQTPGGRDAYDGLHMPRIRDTTRVMDVDEDNSYSVFVSYVEIYNNYIYDLLEELPYDPITGYKAPTSKILREDSGHNMYVSGVVEMEVKSTEEAYEMFYKGQKRRKVAHTALNTESSRSHSVFCIRVVQAPLDPIGEEVLQDKEKVCVSQLALVDLAGSERTLRTGNAGDRLREAGSINQSLMVLRTCIETLRENQKFGTNKMVQYRDSRLTHLFKNYFDGEGKVRMIVCVNPSSGEYDETLQVMKFAEMTQEVQVARPMGAYFDVCLTPGRRRIHQHYKDALATLPTTAAEATDNQLTELRAYSLGPPFPTLMLTDPSDDRTLMMLASFLKDRETRRNTLHSDLEKREQKFRQRLLEVESENNDLRSRLMELDSQLTSKDLDLSKAQKRLRSLEKSNESLQHRTSNYEQERRDLEREIGEREWKILQEKMDKDRLRQDYKAKLVLTEQHFNQRMEQTTRKLKQENYAQLNAKQQKLDLLRNIINQDSDASTTPAHRLRATPAPAKYGSSRIYPAQSEPDLSSVADGNKMPPPTPKFVPRAVVPVQLKSVAVPRTSRARSPPPVKPKPVINAKFHRRSKSTSDDVWLDHRPQGTIEIGTLMQPKMKKRKSVTTLNEKDTRDANKYVLTHQDRDSDGGLATKLVKGDILTTPGGGTAVIFNDVEVITKKSPGDRKRRSPSARPEDFDGEWTDTETRCNVALEGHGHGFSKKSKTAAI